MADTAALIGCLSTRILRASCISSFAWRIELAQTAAYFVRIRVAMFKLTRDVDRQQQLHPEWSDLRARMELMKENLPCIRRKPGFPDTWLECPEYTVNERTRAAAYLADRSDYDQCHLAARPPARFQRVDRPSAQRLASVTWTWVGSLLVIDSLVAVAIITDVQ